MPPVPQADSEIPELYADGIFDIGFGSGMVRIDFFSLSAVRKDENGQPLPAVRQRVVMSLQGFLNGLATMDGMRQRLEAAGVLVPAGHAPHPGGPTPAHRTAAGPRPQGAPGDRIVERPVPPKSPNFS